MTCGEKFYGLVDSMLDGPSMAEPTAVGVDAGIFGGVGVDPLLSALTQWRDANEKMRDQTAGAIAKLGELDPERALITAEVMGEFERLAAANMEPLHPAGVTVEAAILVQHKRAQDWACLLEQVNDELASFGQGLPDMPAKRPGLGIAGAAGLGLAILLIVFLVGRD